MRSIDLELFDENVTSNTLGTYFDMLKCCMCHAWNTFTYTRYVTLVTDVGHHYD